MKASGLLDAMPSAPPCDVGPVAEIVCARLWSNILYTKDGVSGIQLYHATTPNGIESRWRW